MTYWKLVPLDPTLEMAKAAIALDPKCDLDAKFRAMVNAAPSPPHMSPDFLPMPQAIDRRPLDDDKPDGYLESNRDWAHNNDPLINWLADNHGTVRTSLALVEQMAGALNFILAFYEPGQTHLDTNAWTQAEAGGRRALAAAKAAGFFGG